MTDLQLREVVSTISGICFRGFWVTASFTVCGMLLRVYHIVDVQRSQKEKKERISNQIK